MALNAQLSGIGTAVHDTPKRLPQTLDIATAICKKDFVEPGTGQSMFQPKVHQDRPYTSLLDLNGEQRQCRENVCLLIFPLRLVCLAHGVC